MLRPLFRGFAKVPLNICTGRIHLIPEEVERYAEDNIHHFSLTEGWYKYKDEALRKIAVEWYQENNLAYY